jgi:tetratricopeptide (TPR) repeat protein
MSEPGDSHAFRTAREAEGYYELELYEDALLRAELLLSEGHLEDFAVAMKADCLRGLGRWEEGAAAFEALIRSKPEAVAAYVGLGWCQKRAGRLDLAIEAMERLLAARPEEAIGLFNLACYLSLAGESVRALSLLDASIRKDATYRKLAETEEDFAALRGDPTFQKLLSA